MLPRAVLDVLTDVAADNPDIRAVYVFGSRATGRARADSDVDVGVLYGRSQSTTAPVALAERIETALGGHVDVVDVARASAFLALDIVRGERVFCRDELETDRFELYVLRRAGDLLPFEKQRQALLLGSPLR
jgi:predicted nucleotidyltransferase